DPKDPSFATLAIVELAYAWRFLPPADATRRTRDLARMARAAGIKDLDAGARYLAGFGSPQGESAFAEQLLPEPGFARSAGLARVLALIGMGRPDTAMALAHQLAYRFPELEVFVGELAGVLLLADVDSAPAATNPLRGSPAQDIEDPFWRVVLHLTRASWNEAGTHPGRAIADLIWHENSDLHGYPSGDPQPAEVDWAFTAFAQWRLGELLERTGQRREQACRAYATVVRLWSGGDPPYRARADS